MLTIKQWGGGHSPLTSSNSVRNLGIDLLKIIASFLIVICHVTMSLEEHTYLPMREGVIELSAASADTSHVILTLFYYLGMQGNLIFLVCLVWVLLERPHVEKRKIVFTILEIWLFSVLAVMLVLVLRQGRIDAKLLMKQFFPTTFSNNWFMTAYLILYAIHPYLNAMIAGMSRRQHLLFVSVAGIMYFGVSYVTTEFFSSKLIIWIVIYITIGYVKRYHGEWLKRRKVCWGLFSIGVLGNIGIVLATNCLGLYISAFAHQMKRWYYDGSPFFLLTAIGLLGLLKELQFEKSKPFAKRVIEAVAGYSALIYVIHENQLFRFYYRPLIFEWIYQNIGYRGILGWVILWSVIIFAGSFVIGVCYRKLFAKLLHQLTDYMMTILSYAFQWLYQRI